MGNNYLQGLIEKLETLQSAIAIGNREDINQARKNLEQHVGSFNQFVNFLRKQQSLHGCQNDCTYQAIDWCSDALRRHKRPYPGLWDGLATKKFIAELKRWAASGGKAGDTTKKWYRSRTIQNALIGAGVLILVSVVGWFLNSRSNKQGVSLQKNVSTSPDVETRGNLSPAVVTSGPNSPVNIYLTPGQSETRSEVREMDVNRPK